MSRMDVLFTFTFTFLMFVVTLAHTAPSVDDYGALPTTSMMSLSADGKKLAFRKFEGGKDLLVVYSLEQGKVLRAVDVASVNPQHFYFISDGQLIIRAAQHRQLYGMEGKSHYISAAYVLDIEKGHLEQLLKPGHNVYLGQANVGNIIALSADRKQVFMPAYVDDLSDRHSGSIVRYGGVIKYTVMKVNLEMPSHPHKMYEGDRDSRDYFMGPNKEILVQERYNEHSNRHEILVKDGTRWRQIYDKKVSQREVTLEGLTPDYKSLVILTYGDDSDRKRYLTMSLADGKITDPGFNREDADIDGLISDINRLIYGVRYSGFLPSYKLFDETSDRLLQSALKRFTDNSVSLISWSDDWSKLLVLAEGSGYPQEYYLFDAKSEPKFLGAAYPNIKPEHVHPMAKVRFAARDGLSLPMLLTIPNKHVAAMKNLPAIMLPHGGPEAYDQIGFDWLAQALANEGYLVVQPQFRGSSGFGYKHHEAGYGEWGGKMQDDLSDALDFLVNKGYVNKEKVCAVGASYGGYAALLGGAATPQKYRCIVSINGISELVEFMVDIKSKYGRNHSVLSYLENFLTKDGLDEEKLMAISPAYHAEKFTAPVLLIHGTRDETVKREQSDIMADHLREAQKRVQYIKLADESHHLVTNTARLQTVRAVVDFVNANLR